MCSSVVVPFLSPSTGAVGYNIYRPHTEYDGKVMFSVCLFTGGGAPGGTPVELGGGTPGGTPVEQGGCP